SQPRSVSHFNQALAQLPLAQPEFLRYRTFDGRQIEAALLRPPGAEAGTKLPTIFLIHGGPTGNWSDEYEPWPQLLANAGYAVLCPNIRGSTGYGYDFMVLNRGDWGGADFKDVMAGVDYLIAQGIADPQRLGVAGWSYGGYMAEWAITQTSRFKAAVSGAGMSDLASEFSTEVHPAYDEWFYGLPYEKPDGFRHSSPLTYIKNAHTPTLILQGDADVIDPLGQSQALYRALKRYGVETELVVYPRERHGLKEEKHLVDRLYRIVAWFEKYLTRIDAIDKQGPAINSVLELNSGALAMADAADKERRDKGARGPLHGIPVLIKDNIDTADRMETTAGSLAMLGSRCTKDAFVVQKLREAGAVILGKTNLSEWANIRSSHSSSGWSGRGGQTKNPYALDRNPCGSSSGSGAATGANLCAAAVGT